jgi:hypothetical protein
MTDEELYQKRLGEFIRSEKDIRPFEQTREIGGILPLALSGYNRSPAGMAVPGMVQSVGDAITAPSRVLKGEVPPERIPEEAFNFAGSVTGGATAFAKRPGSSLGTGGGYLRAPDTPVDNLGFYSKALDAARTWKQERGTPDQVIAQLKKAGTGIEAEIEATGLRSFLADKSSVSKQEVVDYLSQNRTELAQFRYSDKKAQFRSYSLDLTAPGYEEIVVALKSPKELFDDSHFPQKNIVGHLQVSNALHEGKPAVVLNQVQSDWGQQARVTPKLYEKTKQRWEEATQGDSLAANVRRILEEGGHKSDRIGMDDLRFLSRLHENNVSATILKNVYDRDPLIKRWMDESYEIQRNRDLPSKDAVSVDEKLALYDARIEERYRSLIREDPVYSLNFDMRRMRDILSKNVQGHPMVSSTDQWVDVMMKTAVKNAADKGASYVAVPTGDTVLTYNSGKRMGMKGFYEGIVPKNLHRVLKELDPDTPPPQFVDKIESGFGMINRQPNMYVDFKDAKYGFHVVPITDKAAKAIRERGQSLYQAGVPGLTIQDKEEQDGQTPLQP